ncbi:MAG: ATP-binding cassette domain-containing protein [Nocardioidaceae bacterium]|nr:ATP-binding cassette domain-containing protein [Nocardioidaceae bacterium]
MTTPVRVQPGAVPWVAVTGLSHRYDDRLVLDDLTLRLSSGVTGLVGVNGAGKTTLLHAMATVLRPDAGDLVVDGQDYRRDLLGVRRRVALAPQVFAPPAGMRVEEFLTYLAWMRGVPRRERAAAVARVLDVVELTDRADSRLASLSGGMVQRVNIAQALLADPALLLLDEPMDGLDPEQRVRIRKLVDHLGDTTCVVLSSHVMDDIVPIADRVLMLDAGRIVFDDTPSALGELGAGLVAAGAGLSPHEAAFLALRTTIGAR